MRAIQMKNRFGGMRGQSVLELALILPILLMLVFGIAEFGRAWMTLNVLTGAVREGARIASVTPDIYDNQSQILVQRVVEQYLATANITPEYVRISRETNDEMIRVEAAVHFSFMRNPFARTVLGSDFMMIRYASCYYEGQV